MSDLLEGFNATALPFMRNIYGAAFKMCGNREVAEDVTQDTYLRAYRTFHGFEAGTNCKAWLFTIMQSVLINRFKHGQRHPHTALDDLPHDSPVLAQTDPALMALVDHAPSPQVEAALSALPDAFRMAVVLVDVEEFTYEEAARMLECPVGTVRSRLHRARLLLFDALRDHARQSGYGAERERGA